MFNLPFMELLESRLRDEEKIFKFRSVELNGNELKIELLVNHRQYDNLLSEDLQKKILTICKEFLPSSINPLVRYIKTATNETVVVKHIMDFIYREKPTVFSYFQDAPIEVNLHGNEIFIKVTMEKYLADYAVNSSLKEELEGYLDRLLMEKSEIEFFEVPNKDEQLTVKHRPKSTGTLRVIDVDISDYFVGRIAQNPRYILDLTGKESSQVCICGAVESVRVRYIEKIEKNIYSFVLNDTTGRMSCKYFGKPPIPPMTAEKGSENTAENVAEVDSRPVLPKKKRSSKYVDWDQVFFEGKKLVMQGEIKFDTFDNAYVFFPKGIASCDIQYGSINVKSDFLSEAECYYNVFPERIAPQQQESFISVTPNPDLMNKTYVVFDLETTGLDAVKNEIIEIGGIKIVNGEICESFATLVKPRGALNREIIELTNITDEMLSSAYAISDVIGDFYKFTRNSVLVAHHADFDIGFLSVAGKNNKYDFDNSYMDTLAMARRLVKSKNYKLATLCEKFNISLEGAHRAVNDAMATARLFIELMNLSTS